MLIGVFSDIHANLPALQVILDFLKQKKVHFTLCCGDIVGYGPYPNECIELLSELGNFYCTAGNHDRAVLGKEDLRNFNYFAREAILWTRTIISGDSLHFLEKLQDKETGRDFVMVHASLRNPVSEYITTPQIYRESLKLQDKFILFNGHTHYPLCFEAKDHSIEMGEFVSGRKLELNKEARYMLNVGSVGQPRDSNPDACCLVFDTLEQSVILYRLEYPVKTVQDAMRRHGLPELLIERISRGL
ncbi:MAG TPA: metallophosphoesterase [bacterium]|nr:metallophosphoesterase [bacterium]